MSKNHKIFLTILIIVDCLFIGILITFFNIESIGKLEKDQNDAIETASISGSKMFKSHLDDTFINLTLASNLVTSDIMKRGFTLDELIDYETSEKRGDGFLPKKGDCFDYMKESFKSVNGRISIVTENRLAYSIEGAITDVSNLKYSTDSLNGNKVIEFITEDKITKKPACILSVPIYESFDSFTILGALSLTLSIESFSNLIDVNPYGTSSYSYNLVSSVDGSFLGSISPSGDFLKVNDFYQTNNDIFASVTKTLQKNGEMYKRYRRNNVNYIAYYTNMKIIEYSVYFTNGDGTEKENFYIYTECNIRNLNVSNSSLHDMNSLTIIIALLVFVTVIYGVYVSEKSQKFLRKLIQEKDNSKKDLDNFINSVPTGLVKLMLNKNELSTLYHSNSFLNILGYTAKEFEEINKNGEEINMIYEPDRAIMYKAFEEAALSGEEVNVDIRVNRGENNLGYLNIIGNVNKEIDGYYSLFGTVRDVTREKNLSIEFENEKIRYRLALKSLSIDVLEYNLLTDHIDIFDQGGFKDGALKISKNFDHFLRDDIHKKVLFVENGDELKEVLLSDLPGELEIKTVDNNNVIHWYKINCEPTFNNDGIHAKTFCTLAIIDEQKRLEEQLIQKSKIDQQTLLLNKISFEKEVQAYLKKDKHAGFLIIDIDDFKKINDQFGHLFADTILISLTSQLKNLVGENGICGRIGGDEFAVYINNVKNLEELTSESKKIQDVLSQSYKQGSNVCNVTCSIGVAGYPSSGKDYKALFKASDLALYHAKKEGKNHFVIYDKEKHKNDNIGYYNDYETQDSRVSSDFVSSILNYSFELIEHTSDMGLSIKTLLERMGVSYNLKSATLYTINEATRMISANNRWARDTSNTIEAFKCILSEKMEAEMRDLEKDNIIIVNNLKKDQFYISRDILTEYGVNAFVNVSSYRDNDFEGFISFESNEKIHNWEFEEISAFSIITKVIMSYMIRVKVLEEKNKAVDEVTNIDTVTGLATIFKFKNDGQKLLQQNKTKYAVVYSDILNFKHYNSTYGYDNGDLILRNYAEFIKKIYPDTSLNARSGGDTFISLIPYEKEVDVYNLVDRNNEFYTYTSKGEKIPHIVIRTGICFIEGKDIITSIDAANLARKTLKEIVESDYAVFNESVQKESERVNEIIRLAPVAIKRKEFIVYYQPKYDIETGKICGAEALVRWLRNGVLIGPNEFIPIFERNGFITDVDFFVYETTFKFIRDYNINIPISVNVSRAHLSNDTFVDNVMKLFKKYDINKEFVEFEITESLFFDNKEKSIETINKLSELGFMISIDDFGTGYSSLNVLEDIRANVIKLDRTFLPDNGTKATEKKMIIVRKVIEMAEKMDIDVICEGVETIEHVNILKHLGCGKAQGFYYSRPLDAASFILELSKHQK